MSDFRFDIRLEDGYIHAESSGTETPDTMRHVYEHIVDKMIEWDCNRVLYIEGFSNQISMQDMFVEWWKIFRMVEEKDIHGYIAVYDKIKEDHTVNLVSESLANARGINAKVFNDPDDALMWLKKLN